MMSRRTRRQLPTQFDVLMDLMALGTMPPMQLAVPVPTTLFLKKFGVVVELVQDSPCEFQVSLSLECLELDQLGFVTDPKNLIQQIREAFADGILRAHDEQLAAGVIHVAYHEMGGRLLRAQARVYNPRGHVEVHWSVMSGLPVPSFPHMIG